jgi:hypothetical protein
MTDLHILILMAAASLCFAGYVALCDRVRR